MYQEAKFYICEKCKNIIEKVEDAGVPVMCCGGPMKELKANTTDAAQEKHVPVVEVKDGIAAVKVGSTMHPMEEGHFIGWIYLKTNHGVYKKQLKTDKAPEAKFMLADDEKVEEVYAYCNQHGLWKA